MPRQRLDGGWSGQVWVSRLAGVIHEVDSALRALIERETGIRDVEVVFDAPTRDWAGRRTVPTIDVYLYDIREDLRRRERGVLNEYNQDQTRIVGRHLPPRHFKLSYLVTAWTQRPEDEHRLLSALLAAFLRFDALPAELLDGPLAELGLPVPLTVGLPPPEDRGFADVWSALGGELKPSIDVVVSAPINTGQRMEVGPPVTEPPLFHFGGSAGLGGPEELSFAVDNTGPEGAGKPAQTIRGPGQGAASGPGSDRGNGFGADPTNGQAADPATGVTTNPSPRADQGTEAGDPRRVSMRRRRMSIKKPS
jgi:hypothetical protein